MANITVLYGGAIQLQAKGIGITNLYGGVKLTEVSRQTKTVRVTNPTDPSSFVDVQKVISLIMKDDGGAQHNFNFDPTR